MDINDLYNDENFTEATKSVSNDLLPEGKYVLECLGRVTVKRGKTSGNRYANFAFRPISTVDGEPAQGNLVYHMAMLEGVSSKGKPLGYGIIRTLKGFGLDKDTIQAIHQDIIANTEDASASDGKDISLAIGGVPFSLEGKQVTAKVSIEEGTDGYKDKNRITSFF